MVLSHQSEAMGKRERKLAAAVIVMLMLEKIKKNRKERTG